MKAPKFRHSRGTAPRQGLALCLLLALLLGPGFALAQPSADVDFICPCSIEYHGLTTVKVKVGIKNYSDTASERFRLRIVANRRNRVASGSGYHVFDSLAPGATINGNKPIVVPIDWPPVDESAGDTIRFIARLEAESGYPELTGILVFGETALSLPEVGGGSRYIYIEGTPRLQVDENRATVTIPKLVNTHPDAVTLLASLLHATHPPPQDPASQDPDSAVIAARGVGFSQVVPGRSSVSNVSFSGSWTQPTASHPYTYLRMTPSQWIRNEDGQYEFVRDIPAARLSQTIATRGGRNIPTTSDFGTVASVDHHSDADEDGISDYTEGLLSTDPNDADSKPGTSVLDILVVYSPEWAQVNSEPLATITHHVEWANMALRNSDIDASFRLAKARAGKAGEVKVGLSSLSRTEDYRGERQMVGADLLVLYTVVPAGNLPCGRATGLTFHPSGSKGEGDGQISLVVGCRAGDMAHEIGHNLGLGHSARQQSNFPVGISRWSRGHGALDNFVTIMAYSSAYDSSAFLPDTFGRTPESLQYFSNPDLRLCTRSFFEPVQPCGASRDQALAADAASTLRNVMPLAARWASNPPDDDNDGIINFLDSYPNDPAEVADTDGDKIGNNADMDDDGDGLTDIEEARLGTNPLKKDTDGDGVNDNLDAFPNDATEWRDRDRDGLGHNTDADDYDASVTWIFKLLGSLGSNVDVIRPANLIATFDDDTEGPAAIRANTSKYEVTGVFADPGITVWNNFDDQPNAVRIGDASVATWRIGDRWASGNRDDQATGTIKIKGVTLFGNYINFLASGGQRGGGADVGIKLFAAGTENELATFDPNEYRCRGYMYVLDPTNSIGLAFWKHFDVSALVGQSVDILIYDNEDSNYNCGGIAFDHFYQSDHRRGRHVGTGTLTQDTDEDGVAYGMDANDNDARVTWTRKRVTLTADATVAANLIATFDDTTEDMAAIRADAVKYTLSGAFADTGIASWNSYATHSEAARVGAASVSTYDLRAAHIYARAERAVGAIKINGVTLAGDYLNFLMAGGDGSADVGIKLYATGTSTELAAWKSEGCDRYLRGDSHWRHFDVRVLDGQSVDIEIYDADGDNDCGFISFDHFYQSDFDRGSLVGTATAPTPVVAPLDTDGDKIPDSEDMDDDNDGTPDVDDAFPLDATETTDTDGDKIGNNADLDDDGDGTPDVNDAFPLDASETTDTDGDKIGNNADLDDDGDGTPDVNDAFPLDATETTDTDGDRIGNNADPDDDNDGTPDADDAFPLDPNETTDTDGDRIGNNADPDDDNDGTPDADDAFPLDATETTDTDGDRIGNNADLDDDGDGTPDVNDAFPFDPNETTDTDGDRIGNNADPDDDNDGLTDEEEAALGTNPLLADTDGDTVNDSMDAFPLDASETTDSDGDNVGDNADAFPNDASETADSDNDGVGDNADAFPLDPSETADSDSDGVGDNADAFPNDASETADSDNDGVGDNADAFPNDRTETADSDGDGVGDNREAAIGTNPHKADTDGDGTPDGADDLPLNPRETVDADGDGVGARMDYKDDNPEVAFNDRSFGVGLVLKPDAVHPDNVIASFEDPVAMQDDPRFILTGLFADPELAADGWNIFEQ